MDKRRVLRKRVKPVAKKKAAPKTEEEKIREMALYGSPDEEIAGIMGHTVESLRKQYGAVIDAGREEGKENIRQWNTKPTPEQKKRAEREIRKIH